MHLCFFLERAYAVGVPLHRCWGFVSDLVTPRGEDEAPRREHAQHLRISACRETQWYAGAHPCLFVEEEVVVWWLSNGNGLGILTLTTTRTEAESPDQMLCAESPASSRAWRPEYPASDAATPTIGIQSLLPLLLSLPGGITASATKNIEFR